MTESPGRFEVAEGQAGETCNGLTECEAGM
jgi:hypothetical protein